MLNTEVGFIVVGLQLMHQRTKEAESIYILAFFFFKSDSFRSRFLKKGWKFFELDIVMSLTGDIT